jgi:type I restriction enzyme R subunit
MIRVYRQGIVALCGSLWVTSKMLSTGVDVQDLRFVVLFKPVGSMVEFKQIIGRGTRLYPEAGKTFFEIIDYVGATGHFQDPEFDGYPQHVRVETIDGSGSVVTIDSDPVSGEGEYDEAPPAGFVGESAPDFTAGGSSDDSESSPDFDAPRSLTRKRYVNDGDFTVLAEGHYVPDTSTGRLRLTEYAEYVANEIRSLFQTPGELTQVWANGVSREDVIDLLSQRGVDVNELAEQAGMSQADPVDVLVALAWNVAAPTRTERARRAREAHHAELGQRSELAREVLGALLDRYAENGIEDVTSGEALRLPPIDHLGSPVEIAAAFGGPVAFHAQVDELQRWLYSA